MLRLFAAYVGLCLCACAQESGVSVYLHAHDSLPASVSSAMQVETKRLIGEHLEWRDARKPQEDAGRIVVVKFSGACSLASYNPARPTLKDGESLASTAITDGRILPFVTIECSRIRDRIASRAIGGNSRERDAAMGRAMGRVLAHEIYHVLSGDRRHAGSGLAAACVSTRDLLADRFDLDSRSLAQMRQINADAEAVIAEFDADDSGRD